MACTIARQQEGGGPLLTSPLTTGEKEQLAVEEAAIQHEFKLTVEAKLRIGQHLSTIYNEQLFRGDGTQSWENYLKAELPRLMGLRDDSKNVWTPQTATLWRQTWEVRHMLAKAGWEGEMPSLRSVQYGLGSLLPRVRDAAGSGSRWTRLDEDGDTSALLLTWEEALRCKESGGSPNLGANVKKVLEPVREKWEAEGIKRSNRGLVGVTYSKEAIIPEVVLQQASEPEPTPKPFKAVVQPSSDCVAFSEADEQAQKLASMAHDYSKALIALERAMSDVKVQVDRIKYTKGTQYLAQIRRWQPSGELLSNYAANDVERLQGVYNLLRGIVKDATSSEPPADPLANITLEVN